MTKVICADDGCMWNNENKCTAKAVNLSWHSILTVHDGRQEYHRCKMRESPAEHRRKANEHQL